MLGLSGQDPEYILVENIDGIIKSIKEKNQINLDDEFLIPFSFHRILFSIKSFSLSF
jgi:L-serine dehydratase